jgi:FKBP-type peptidyl-prolyl cis-trans isomerase
MKKLNFSLALLAMVLLAACGQQDSSTDAVDAAPDVALDTTEERLSYGIAFGLGERLKSDGVPLDVAAFGLGLQHAFDGTEPLLTQEEIGQEMQAYQEKQNATHTAAAGVVAEENANAGAAFLMKNAEVEGVVTLESGLQYKVETMGDGPKPTATDTVEVHYRGTLLDGTEFDSSYARGSTVSFVLNQVIPGWTEALQLMPTGSKWQLYIPSDLAYGAGGAGGSIGPNSTLIFDVELIQIAPSEPSAATKEPSAATKEPSAAIKEPSASAEEPSAPAEEPSAPAEEPSAATE